MDPCTSPPPSAPRGSWRRLALLALLVSLSFAVRGSSSSCDGSAVPVETGPECQVDADCEALLEYDPLGDGVSALRLSDDPARGPLCSAGGACVACKVDADCAPARACAAGACVSACEDDDGEDDDTPASAGALDPAALAQRTLTACPGDPDWLCTAADAPVAAGTTIVVGLDAGPAAVVDAALHVLDDESGAPLRLDAVLGAANEPLVVRAPRRGRYCVRVTAAGDAPANYTLHASFRPAEEPGYGCAADADCAPAGCGDACPVCLDRRCVQDHPAPAGAPDPFGGEWRREGGRFVPRCPATELLVHFSAPPDAAFATAAWQAAGQPALGGFPALRPVFPAPPGGQAAFPEIHRLVLQTELGPDGLGVLDEGALWHFANAVTAEPFATTFGVTAVELNCRVVVALGSYRPVAVYADDFQPAFAPAVRLRHRLQTRLAPGDDPTDRGAVVAAPGGSGGARVGLLDTGVDGRVVVGVGATDGATGRPTHDRFGHGTHMATLLREVEATVTSYRVLDGDGRGTFAQLAWGIASAAYAGERILNLSVGWAPRFGESRLVRRTLEYLADRRPDVLVVAAAGNREFTPEETTSLFYPAAHRGDFDTLVAVDGVRPNDRPIVLAVPGVETDLVAPALLVYGGWPRALLDPPPKTAALADRGLTGTSVAAAQVSAAAANVWNAAPTLTAAEVIVALVDGGVSLSGDPGPARGVRLDHCGALAAVGAAPAACGVPVAGGAIADGAFVPAAPPADFMGAPDRQADRSGAIATELRTLGDLVPGPPAAIFDSRYVEPQPVDPGGIDGILDPQLRRLDGTIKPDFPTTWVGNARVVVSSGVSRPVAIDLGPATAIRVASQIRVLNLALPSINWASPAAAASLAIPYRTAAGSTALSVTQLRVNRSR